MEKLYTIPEAAEQMRCSAHTVRRRIKSGELKFVRNGRKYLITQTAIDEFFANSAKNNVETVVMQDGTTVKLPSVLTKKSHQPPTEERKAIQMPDSWKK